MTTQEAQKVLFTLKTHTLSIPLASTPLGTLSKNINKDETEWFFTLDSVPLPKELNNDLKKLFNID